MIPAELTKKIRILQITTRKVINDVLSGEYVGFVLGLDAIDDNARGRRDSLVAEGPRQ